MERLKKAGKVLGVVVVVVVVVAGIGYGWASWKVGALRAVTYEAHVVDFPIPFPLSEEEVEALREERRAELAPPPAEPAPAEPEDAEGEDVEPDAAEGEDAETVEAEAPEPPAVPDVDPLEGVDLDAIALERAVERGRHLVEARYACIECHGDDFSGGTMIDDPGIGSLFGPNLTGGEGSRVGEWAASDWDRAVRHGIFPDGTPSIMPAEDYQRMSDHELSDVIAYIRSFPAVANEVAPMRLGPIGTILAATGQIPFSVDRIEEHHAAHAVSPPETAPTVEFGEHLAGVCTGCHGDDLAGGPVPGGAPDWLPAANLTPHAEGLEGWTFEDFQTAMREFRRPDGTELGLPMTLMRRYIGNMTDVELEAMWAYLQTVPAQPTGT